MSPPFVIFCADPLHPGAVEPDFTEEVDAAQQTGFSITTLDHDYLDRQIDTRIALKRAKFDAPCNAIYRGWMMSAEAYSMLFSALAERGVRLLTSPEQYAACHHAPGSYAQLQEFMPVMTCLPVAELDSEVSKRKALATFGRSPVIIKDWVKSQAAGYWKEACYIADASDMGLVDNTMSRFCELQGDSLTGGIVFKAYVPLQPVGEQSYEYRAFIVDGKVVGCWPRSEASKQLSSPPQELMDRIARAIPSPFASADFGQDTDGHWWLLEVGDGQVSGLPSRDAAGPIFSALAQSAI